MMNKRQDVWRARLTEGASYIGTQDLPLLQPCTVIPKWLSLYDKSEKPLPESCVHFFQDDYKFERVWNKPRTYLPRIKKVGTVIIPDFSVYPDMPNPLKGYNVFRSRAIGYWWQKQGLNVIPCLRCGDEYTDIFIFDGLPKKATVAVGATGCIKNRSVRRVFINGVYKIIERLEPLNLLIYGTINKKYFPYSLFTMNTNILYYPSETGQMLRKETA